MKNASVSELKKELKHLSQEQLVELCLHLTKFKKENKALLTYLLFESHNEQGYVNSIKRSMDEQFAEVNYSSHYYIKKSVRKILRGVKTYIRYSKNKETEIRLLLHFCHNLKTISPSIAHNTVLYNIHQREIAAIQKKLLVLHEDLQYDFSLELETVML